jgi:hypothetical protein
VIRNLGDVGVGARDIALADEDGYLRIVDRKKEIMINSAGKNMSPTHIECVIGEESPLIGQVVAIGDARRYVTTLIVLDEEATSRARAQQGLPADSHDLSHCAYVQDAIAAAVRRGNEWLARVEQVKAYEVLPGFWAPGGDELTPTMKLKRKVIAEKYAETIEALYAYRQSPTPCLGGPDGRVRLSARSLFSGTNLLAMNVAPCGSPMTVIRTHGASNGGTITFPPSPPAFAAVASASSTAKVALQCAGVSRWSPVIGNSAAAGR